MQNFLNFVVYMVTAAVILSVFAVIYVWTTPYHEIREIKRGNKAAAIAFGGAILGFVIPLASAVYFTHDIYEMVRWGFATCIVQLIVFKAVDLLIGCSRCIADREEAPAILLASFALAFGILNAVSISY